LRLFASVVPLPCDEPPAFRVVGVTVAQLSPRPADLAVRLEHWSDGTGGSMCRAGWAAPRRGSAIVGLVWRCRERFVPASAV